MHFFALCGFVDFSQQMWAVGNQIGAVLPSDKIRPISILKKQNHKRLERERERERERRGREGGRSRQTDRHTEVKTVRHREGYPEKDTQTENWFVITSGCKWVLNRIQMKDSVNVCLFACFCRREQDEEIHQNMKPHFAFSPSVYSYSSEFSKSHYESTITLRECYSKGKRDQQKYLNVFETRTEEV